MASQANLSAERDIIDGVETMYFTDSSGKHVLWIAPWDNQWVVFLYEQQVLYGFIDNDKVDDFILALMKTVISKIAGCDLLTDAGNLDRISRISRPEWTLVKNERIRIEYCRMGWEELSEDEWKTAWNKLSRSYNFENHTSVVSHPVMAWDIQHVLDIPYESTEWHELLFDLERKCLAAMRTTGDTGWLALDFNHPSYRLHTRTMCDTLHPWPVSPLPDVDEAFFVSTDCHSCISTQLRHSISVFGQSLLDAFTYDLPIMCENRQILP